LRPAQGTANRCRMLLLPDRTPKIHDDYDEGRVEACHLVSHRTDHSPEIDRGRSQGDDVRGSEERNQLADLERQLLVRKLR